MNALDKKQSSTVKIHLAIKDNMDFKLEATGKAAEKICRKPARLLSRVLSACHNRSGKLKLFFDLLSSVLSLLGNIVGLFMRNYFIRGYYGFSFLQTLWHKNCKRIAKPSGLQII